MSGVMVFSVSRTSRRRSLSLYTPLNQLAGHAPEGFRRRLIDVFLDFHDVADFIHQQADGAVIAADDDVHGQFAGGARRAVPGGGADQWR